MAKIGLKAYFELDTDPDGDNAKDTSSLFTPTNLMMILPFLDRWFRSKPSDVGASSKAGKVAENEQARVEFGSAIPDGHTGTADCPECASQDSPASPPL